jgi:hypothetical protein
MELGSVTLKRIGFFVFQLNTQHTLKTKSENPVSYLLERAIQPRKHMPDSSQAHDS